MCLIIPHIHTQCQHTRSTQIIEPCPLYTSSCADCRDSAPADDSDYHSFSHVLHTILITAPSLCPSCYRVAEAQLCAHHDLVVEEEQDVLEAFVEDLAEAKQGGGKEEGEGEGEVAMRERNVRIQMGRWTGAVRGREEAVRRFRGVQGVWGDG